VGRPGREGDWTRIDQTPRRVICAAALHSALRYRRFLLVVYTRTQKSTAIFFTHLRIIAHLKFEICPIKNYYFDLTTIKDRCIRSL